MIAGGRSFLSISKQMSLIDLGRPANKQQVRPTKLARMRDLCLHAIAES